MARELAQYQDHRKFDAESKSQRRAHEDLSPKPMYLANEQFRKEYEQLMYPIRTTRQKSIVQTYDVSGNRSKGAQ